MSRQRPVDYGKSVFAIIENPSEIAGSGRDTKAADRRSRKKTEPL